LEVLQSFFQLLAAQILDEEGNYYLEEIQTMAAQKSNLEEACQA
jgi:hypothetical protein